METAKIDDVIDKFISLTEKPVKYLSVQNNIKDDIKSLIKSLYDYTKSQESKSKSKSNQSLSEIIVSDFDEEQIWQQIDLHNVQIYDQLTREVAKFISTKSDLIFPVKLQEDNDNKSDISEDEIIPELSTKPTTKTPRNKPESEIEEPQAKFKKSIKTKSRSSIVDDKFFKLQDMERFLLNEEKMEGRKDDDSESINLFEDQDEEDFEEDGGNKVMYSDFFNEDEDVKLEDVDDQNDLNDNEIISSHKPNGLNGSNKKKRVRFSELMSDESDSENSKSDSENSKSKVKLPTKKAKIDTENEKQSEFEKRQQRLKNQISKLEEKSLTEAPWQLKGEVDAKRRPENSLLQEVLDFDLTTRPPPIITEQTTLTLEGLIQQRIKDKAWDDVERKEKPVDDQLNFKKSVVLDQAKSQQSLSQIYEAEYLKQKQALNGEVDEEEPENYKEIRDLMTKLFAKLDALCHYHYTPKVPQAEVKIVSNTPAISMEEVAPVATSEATLLAPEEIKRKQKGDIMSKEERTKTDKNRERRRKKQLQRKKGNVMKVTDQRNTIKGVEANDKSLKTSRAFFQQLNDQTTSIIKKSKKAGKNK